MKTLHRIAFFPGLTVGRWPLYIVGTVGPL